MASLLAEWLATIGMSADTDAERTEPPAALILIDLPFPRQGGRERLTRLSDTWSGVPVVALSSTLLPHVPPRGEVANALGAAAVLPSPLSRDLLCDTIASLVNA